VGKRVVTSFEVLAGQWFKDIDQKAGIAANGEGSTKVEYVGGSVEAACALGLADGIGEHDSLSRYALVYTHPCLFAFS
jgi:ATP phosphoribosyltransferase